MAARRIHFDVESYRTRNQTVIDALTKEAINAVPAQNTAKYIKDEWHTKKSINERIACALAKTSCKPLHAEPLVICIKTESSDLMTIDVMEQLERDALLIFTEFSSDMSDKNTIWTGFNIKGFDLPLLLNRMIKHNVRPPEYYPNYNGHSWQGRIYDSMERLPTPEKMAEKFKMSCEIYGLPCKTIVWADEPMCGSRVGEVYEAGDYQVIRDYCADDVINEEQLYLAMTHNDTWGTYDTGRNDLSALAEIIADDELSPAHKWATALPILKQLNY